METTTTTKILAPFKSARAARIAFGKLERAWEAARDARIGAQHARRDPATSAQPTAEERARLDELEATYKALPEGERYPSGAFSAFCDLWNEIHDRPERVAQAAEDAAWQAMVDCYDRAKSQGIWLNSYELNTNSTRDLIRANID